MLVPRYEPPPRISQAQAQMFLDRVWSVGADAGPNACWPYPAVSRNRGYVQINIGTPARSWYVHRLAHLLLNGPIPDGHEVDHVKARGCTQRSCCNPAHLETVTRRENIRRGGNAAKTHCPAGHEYTPENTRIKKRPETGWVDRQCRICIRAAKKRAKQRKRGLQTS